MARVLDADLRGQARDDRPPDPLACPTQEHGRSTGTPARPRSSTASEPAAAAKRSARASDRPGDRRDARADEDGEERREERVPCPGRVDLVFGRCRQVAQHLDRSVFTRRHEQAAVAALGHEQPGARVEEPRKVAERRVARDDRDGSTPPDRRA